jgi:response regulator RpfG family c-di-GMP phosphodiesterase
MTARDGLTQQHAQRVQLRALALAREVGVTDDLELDAIEGAALLHDIGVRHS